MSHQTCHICGITKPQSEMEGTNILDTTYWHCSPLKDPDCAKSQARRFSPYAGWRRANGLEPLDQAPGSQPVIQHYPDNCKDESIAIVGTDAELVILQMGEELITTVRLKK
jgi:hypothetical protein